VATAPRGRGPARARAARGGRAVRTAWRGPAPVGAHRWRVGLEVVKVVLLAWAGVVLLG
jgi:hypothetical protein